MHGGIRGAGSFVEDVAWCRQENVECELVGLIEFVETGLLTPASQALRVIFPRSELMMALAICWTG